MELTIEEREMMEGKHGKTLAKVIRTVVEYGTLFGAQRLIPLDKPVTLLPPLVFPSSNRSII